MPSVDSTPNCGVYFLEGVREFVLDSVEHPVVEFFQELDAEMNVARRTSYVEEENRWVHIWRWPAMIMFSDARSQRDRRKTSGEHFATYLRKNNLGKVTGTGWVKNPNTKNLIKVWTWFVDARRLDQHIKELEDK